MTILSQTPTLNYIKLNESSICLEPKSFSSVNLRYSSKHPTAVVNKEFTLGRRSVILPSDAIVEIKNAGHRRVVYVHKETNETLETSTINEEISNIAKKWEVEWDDEEDQWVFNRGLDQEFGFKKERETFLSQFTSEVMSPEVTWKKVNLICVGTLPNEVESDFIECDAVIVGKLESKHKPERTFPYIVHVGKIVRDELNKMAKKYGFSVIESDSSLRFSDIQYKSKVIKYPFAKPINLDTHVQTVYDNALRNVHHIITVFDLDKAIRLERDLRNEIGNMCERFVAIEADDPVNIGYVLPQLEKIETVLLNVEPKMKSQRDYIRALEQVRSLRKHLIMFS